MAARLMTFAEVMSAHLFGEISDAEAIQRLLSTGMDRAQARNWLKEQERVLLVADHSSSQLQPPTEK